LAVISDADFYPELGRKIRALREERQLSQEQLGARLRPELKRGTISAIESARQRVMAHLIAQLSEVLDVEPSHFFPERDVTTRLDAELKQFSPEVAQNITAALDALERPTGVRGRKS
jgi:transcriptional regulator with XRE-family HTH domain